jgi:hypothetical protein
MFCSLSICFKASITCRLSFSANDLVSKATHALTSRLSRFALSRPNLGQPSPARRRAPRFPDFISYFPRPAVSNRTLQARSIGSPPFQFEIRPHVAFREGHARIHAVATVFHRDEIAASASRFAGALRPRERLRLTDVHELFLAMDEGSRMAPVLSCRRTRAASNCAPERNDNAT